MADAPVTRRLLSALTAHDIDALVDCFHPDYRSEQPAHPDRAFGGREQVRENWSSIFAGVPDVRAELVRAATSGMEEWSELRIHGMRSDGSSMELRGVVINGIRDDRIAWARLYLELVEEEPAGITSAVRRISGQEG